MNIPHAVLLSLFLCSCAQQPPGDNSQNAADSAQSVGESGAEFLRATGNDPWVNWPTDLRYFGSGEQPCVRVSEQSRDAAIRLLAQESARAIGSSEYQELTGGAQPQAGGSAYLLRGFSTDNSAARVTTVGDIVTVHSDALGGLFNPRRYPCVAMLNSVPSEVYTVAAYDL